MLSVASTAELVPRVGTAIGTSTWLLIDEAWILAFGKVTREQHWIHTDAERVRASTPHKGVLAQGFLTLALLTSMAEECIEIRSARQILNYGIDRLRFTAPVVAGDRIRLHLVLGALTPRERRTRLTWQCTVEVEGRERPALVADYLWTVEDA